MDLKDLKIDPEFEEKIPPLTEDEFSLLEQNIVTDGEVLDPLIIWNNTILDGHNRYRILKKHPEIPFKTFPKEFPDKYAAIAWICRNQLGRRNLTPEQKRYLVGKQYKAEKASHGAEGGFRGNQYTEILVSPQNEDLPKAEKETQMKTNELTYKVMDLNTAQLEIPRETYQRELSPDRVRRIVKAFDERIANEPKVSYRSGHYYVFDGQHTMEESILLETRLANPDKKVFKLQFPIGEFDMVVCDTRELTCRIYEVKYSKEQVPEQYRHLNDDEKCSMTCHRYGDIVGKYVIYRGEPAECGGIQYLNVEDYLKSLK